MAQEFRLPTPDAVEVVARQLAIEVELKDVYEPGVMQIVGVPLSWSARLDYDQPLRAAQVVINFLRARPEVFKVGRLICWAMAADKVHLETQRMGLTVLFAVKKVSSLFSKPQDLCAEVDSGLRDLKDYISPSIKNSASALGEEAGNLVLEWSQKKSAPFLNWAAETIYTLQE